MSQDERSDHSASNCTHSLQRGFSPTAHTESWLSFGVFWGLSSIYCSFLEVPVCSISYTTNYFLLPSAVNSQTTQRVWSPRPRWHLYLHSKKRLLAYFEIMQPDFYLDTYQPSSLFLGGGDWLLPLLWSGKVFFLGLSLISIRYCPQVSSHGDNPCMHMHCFIF